MRLLLLLTLAAATTADRKCTGIYFYNRYYDLEIIKEGINNVHQLIYSKRDDTVYFTFDQIAKVPTRALAFLKLDTKEAGLVEGVRNATGLAIDSTRNRIYVGGSDGIYIINDKKVPERFPVQDDVRSLFYKDVLYYTNSRKQAFKFDDGYSYQLNELQNVNVDKLIADDDNNLFFLQNKKLFSVKIGTRAVNSYENFVVDALGTDNHFKPYISVKDGLYVYNKYKYVHDKVSSLNNLKALTFNRDGDPIYITADVLVKLNLNPKQCHEF